MTTNYFSFDSTAFTVILTSNSLEKADYRPVCLRHCLMHLSA